MLFRSGTPNEPAAISAAGSSILNSQIKSLLTESRPAYKSILGIDYGIGDWVFNLNNTLFGKTGFRDLDNGGSIMEDLKQVFAPAVVTDLNIGYNFSKKVNLSVGINNIFNILPSWKLEASTLQTDAAKIKASTDRANAVLNSPTDKNLLEGFLEFSGRYRILGYNGSQFSQLGTVFNTQLTVKF